MGDPRAERLVVLDEALQPMAEDEQRKLAMGLQEDDLLDSFAPRKLASSMISVGRLSNSSSMTLSSSGSPFRSDGQRVCLSSLSATYRICMIRCAVMVEGIAR